MNAYEFQVIGWMKNEKGMTNFGVYQLPLFNHLKPECANCESFLGIRGRRGLNKKVSKKNHVENGYRVSAYL